MSLCSEKLDTNPSRLPQSLTNEGRILVKVSSHKGGSFPAALWRAYYILAWLVRVCVCVCERETERRCVCAGVRETGGKRETVCVRACHASSSPLSALTFG